LVGIIGNHEIPWYDSESNYKRMMGQAYFSFTYGSGYFIVLDDSSETELGKKQGKEMVSE